MDQAAVEASPVRCPDPVASERMVAAIDAARERGDTLGGSAVVSAAGVVAGLGSYAQWDRKLDGLIAQALCSIPSVKGVEIGAAVARRRGRRAPRSTTRPATSRARGFAISPTVRAA